MGNGTKIKFAIIGCGRIGKRHIQMLQQHPQTDLVALVDNKSGTELDLPASIPFFHSLEEFFSSGIKADIITIATPNGLHAEHALKCLEQNHHVLVEKPLALKTKDAQKVLEQAEERGKHVFAVMQNRYAKAATWLKELIESRAMGEIFLVQVNCFWNRDARYYTGHEWHGNKLLDGGTLFTQFAHFVDLLYWMFGNIQNIQGRGGNFTHDGITEFEDTGLLHFEFVNGGIGCLNFTTAVWGQNFESSITIIGDKGTIKISGQYLQTVEYCHVKDLECPPALAMGPNKEAIDALAFNQHYALVNNVVNTLRSGEKTGCSAEDAVKVVGIIERMNNQLKFSLRKSVV